MNIWWLLSISVGIQLLLFLIAYVRQTDKLTDFSYATTFVVLSYLVFDTRVGSLIVLAMITLWAIRLGTYLVIRINHKKRDKRFDEMRSNFGAFLMFWVGQGLVVWVLLIPSFYFMLSSVQMITWLSYVGVIVWVLGFTIETLADWQKYEFKKKHPKKLLTTKLFRYARHPNYFGEIVCWVGMYLFVVSSLTLLQGLLALVSPITIYLILTYATGVPQLDTRWKKVYGAEYETYKKRTNRYVPISLKK